MAQLKPSSTSSLFLFTFLTSATYTATRTLGVSLFLARVGTASLPAVFVVSALLVIAVSLLTRRLISRVRHVESAIVTWSLLATVTTLWALAIGTQHNVLILMGGLYVLAEIRGCLNTIYCVTLANDAFAESKSARPYAITAAGAPVAGAIVGFALSAEASFVRDVELLLIVAIVDLAAAGWLFLSRRTLRDSRGSNVQNVLFDEIEAAIPEQVSQEYPTRHSQSHYRVQLSMLVGLKVAVLTLVAFQWKVAARDYIGSDEARLVEFFAMYFAICDVLIVSLQLLAAGKLLDHFGLRLGLQGLPVLMTVIAVTLLVYQTPLAAMIALTIAQGTSVFRRSIHDPALAKAYSVLDPTVRGETIVIVKGVIKPFAEAGASVILLILSHLLTGSSLTFLWLIFLMPWLFFATTISEFWQRWQEGDEPSS